MVAVRKSKVPHHYIQTMYTQRYPPIPIPSFNWGTEDKFAELSRFRRECRYQFDGPYASLSEPERNMFVLIWMGDEGQRLHEAANMKTDDKTPLSSTWTLFETLFTYKTNPRVFRDKRFTILKVPVESMNSYISRCRQHTECKYTDADDQLVDQIISGLRDDVLRGKLFDDKSIDLVKCIEMCLSHEKLLADRRFYPMINTYDTPTQGNIMTVQQSDPCLNCGKNHDIRPALGSRCSSCERLNHWTNQYFQCSTAPLATHALTMGTRVSYNDSLDEVFIRLTITQYRNNSINLRAKVGVQGHSSSRLTYYSIWYTVYRLIYIYIIH